MTTLPDFSGGVFFIRHPFDKLRAVQALVVRYQASLRQAQGGAGVSQQARSYILLKLLSFNYISDVLCQKPDLFYYLCPLYENSQHSLHLRDIFSFLQSVQ